MFYSVVKVTGPKMSFQTQTEPVYYLKAVIHEDQQTSQVEADPVGTVLTAFTVRV